MLTHTFKLIGSDFRVQNVLFVALLKGVALHNLLLLWGETVQYLGFGTGLVVQEDNVRVRFATLGVVLVHYVLMMLLVSV